MPSPSSAAAFLIAPYKRELMPPPKPQPGRFVAHSAHAAGGRYSRLHRIGGVAVQRANKHCTQLIVEP